MADKVSGLIFLMFFVGSVFCAIFFFGDSMHLIHESNEV